MDICFIFLALSFLIADGVFGDTGEVKTVSVMEGESLTLHTDVVKQKHDLMLWNYGPENTFVARINGKAGSTMFSDDERFRDRVNLDHQTGSLTITNIRIEHTGVYTLKISSNNKASYKKFSVTVYAGLSVPVISRVSPQCSSSSERSSDSTCVLLCSVMNVTHVTLSWYKGNSLFSSISASDLNIRLSLPLEVEYQDTNTYSCVLNNPIRNQTQHLNITDVCGLSRSDLQWLIPVCVITPLAVFAAVGVVVYYQYKSGKEKQNGKPTIIQLRNPANGHAPTEHQHNHLKVYHDDVEDPEEAEPFEICIRNNVSTGDPDVVDFSQSTWRKLSDYDNCSKNSSIPWIEDYESNDERGKTSNEEAGYQSGLNSEAEDQLVDDVITTKSVKEGESVTLTTDDITVTEEDVIIWKFAKSKYSKVKFKVIAERTRTYDGKFVCSDERFTDRLQLDNQTGSLTITDFRDEDIGHYKLLIPGKMFLKTFNVNKKVSTLQRRSSNNW